MSPEKRKEYFSLPNLLSYLRLLLLPPFVFLYTKGLYAWAAAVILLSAATDVADGLIARRYHMVTDWGKILDPLADKLTQATVSGCLLVKYPKMIFLFLLIVIKEGLQGVGGLLLYRKIRKVRSSEWFGKLSTAFFYALVAYMILFPSFASDHTELTNGAILVSGILMAMALLLYVRRFCQAVAEMKQNKASEPLPDAEQTTAEPE